MLRAIERIAQYSDRDLQAIRGRAEIQIGKVLDQLLDDSGSYGPMANLLLETVTRGESIRAKLGEATHADVAAFFRTMRNFPRLDTLETLKYRLDLESQKRILAGVSR